MELRQFRYFVQIAELGSFSRAAQVLYIAQPALSQQIAQLEAELGQPLLVRSSTGVKLTEQGEAFYRHAQRLLKHVADTQAVVGGMLAAPAGNVRLGLPLSTSVHFVAALLPRVQASYPGIQVEFFDEPSGNLRQGLLSGRLDLGILVNDEDAIGLDAIDLMEETLFLMSHPRQAPKRRRIDLAQALALPLALPGSGQGVRPILDRLAMQAGLPPSAPSVVANSVAIVRHLVTQGRAHTIMAWGAASDALAAGTIVATPFTTHVVRRARLCLTGRESLSLAAQAIHSLLLTSIRQYVLDGHWQGVRLLEPTDDAEPGPGARAHKRGR